MFERTIDERMYLRENQRKRRSHIATREVTKAGQDDFENSNSY